MEGRTNNGPLQSFIDQGRQLLELVPHKIPQVRVLLPSLTDELRKEATTTLTIELHAPSKHPMAKLTLFAAPILGSTQTPFCTNP